MNDKTRKYREQLLRIATDMGDWVRAETKDFPKFYENSFSIPNTLLDRPVVNCRGIVSATNKFHHGLYICGGRVYEHSSLHENMDNDKDVTESFLTNYNAGGYMDLVACVECIYRNWSWIKEMFKIKRGNTIASCPTMDCK